MSNTNLANSEWICEPSEAIVFWGYSYFGFAPTPLFVCPSVYTSPHGLCL